MSSIKRVEIMLLDLLVNNHGDPLKAVSSLTGISQTECKRLLAGLVKRGYLTVEGNWYYPTERAKSFWKEYKAPKKGQYDLLSQPLDDDMPFLSPLHKELN